MTPLILWISIIAGLGSALVAGIFFAFSNFVMPALARLESDEGMAAMQAINVTVLNPLFLGIFVGTAVVGGGALVVAAREWGAPWGPAVVAGALLYIIGTFAVTAGRNVPLNDRLEAVSRGTEEGASLWRLYLNKWVFWNHVRTVAATAAALFFMVALTF